AQDHVGRGAGGRRRICSDREDEAVVMIVAVAVGSNDLAGVIDALQNGGTCAAGQRVVNIDEGTTAVKKPKLVAAGVPVDPDDLSCAVDAHREGLDASRWIVERAVYAAAVEEAVGVVASVRVISDDLPRGVDARRNGKVVAEGIVDRREGGAAVGVIEEA